MSSGDEIVHLSDVLYLDKLLVSLSFSAETCEDKVLCKLYSQAICTDPAYYAWRQNNCPKYCGMCATGKTKIYTFIKSINGKFVRG